jgi:hypothetical protein
MGEGNKSPFCYTKSAMSDDIKEILNHLISSPQENQIQIDFDLERKIFFLSISIYRAQNALPRSVKEYIVARKGRNFKPHSTTFEMKGELNVQLIQEIPFRWGFNPGSRQEILDFLQLAKRCHRILYEIALEEKYKEALHLDSDLGA